MKAVFLKTISVILLATSTNALAIEVTTAEITPYVLEDGDTLSISNLGSITLTGDNSIALGDNYISFQDPTQIGALVNNGVIDLSSGINSYGVNIQNLFGYTNVASFTNSGSINISSFGNGYGFNIEWGNSIGPVINTGSISVIGDSLNWPNGDNMYGIAASFNGSVGSINNSGNITIQSPGSNAYGISIETTDFIINSGTISVANDGGNAYGIEFETANFITNSGTINVSTLDNATGINVEDANTIINTGSIDVITGADNATGINVGSTVQSFNNSGSITSTAVGYNAY
jgi:hypothetical protein